MRQNWVDKVEREERVQELKFKVKRKLNDTKDWVVRNKETLIGVAPAAIGGLAVMTKVIGKAANTHKEERIKNRYCYDASLGHYWHLKRDLTNSEWVEIDRRKSTGERLANILADMNVLK